jgi:hypothetical protein
MKVTVISQRQSQIDTCHGRAINISKENARRGENRRALLMWNTAFLGGRRRVRLVGRGRGAPNELLS